MKAWLRQRRALTLAVAGLLLGCGDGTSVFSCLEGAPDCQCRPNGTCGNGLSCISGVCRASQTGGSPGSGGAPTGGAGSAGSGATATGGEGAATTGGAAETGGAPPTGGAPTGGVTPTGGAEPTGGVDPTGGVGAGGSETGGAPPTGGAPGDCSTTTMDPCVVIPYYSGTQTVDGNGAEICTLPFFELNTDTAGHVRVDHTGSESRPESAKVHLGWSEAGLHAYITVTDPAVLPSSNIAEIYAGDSVELMFASNATELTGNPGSDPTTHASIAATPGLAAAISTVNGSASSSPLAENSYQTSVVAPGYTIEVLLPWPGTAPSSGTQIAFDLALNSADDEPADAGDGRDAQAILYLGSVSSSPCGDTAEPWCDDRTWCTPTLE